LWKTLGATTPALEVVCEFFESTQTRLSTPLCLGCHPGACSKGQASIKEGHEIAVAVRRGGQIALSKNLKTTDELD